MSCPPWTHSPFSSSNTLTRPVLLLLPGAPAILILSRLASLLISTVQKILLLLLLLLFLLLSRRMRLSPSNRSDDVVLLTWVLIFSSSLFPFFKQESMKTLWVNVNVKTHLVIMSWAAHESNEEYFFKNNWNHPAFYSVLWHTHSTLILSPLFSHQLRISVSNNITANTKIIINELRRETDFLGKSEINTWKAYLPVIHRQYRVLPFSNQASIYFI